MCKGLGLRTISNAGLRTRKVVMSRGGVRLQIPTSDAHVSAQQQA